MKKERKKESGKTIQESRWERKEINNEGKRKGKKRNEKVKKLAEKMWEKEAREGGRLRKYWRKGGKNKEKVGGVESRKEIMKEESNGKRERKINNA